MMKNSSIKEKINPPHSQNASLPASSLWRGGIISTMQKMPNPEQDIDQCWCKPKNLRVGIILHNNIMKTYRVIFISLFSFLCFSLNAQFFVRGNISFNTSNNKSDDGATSLSKSSNYSLYFSPSVGKFLSENVAIGFALDFYLSGGTSGVTIETKNNSYAIGASPFLRYYAIKWNKFSIFGQGNIGFTFSGSRSTTEGAETDGPKDSRYYLRIYPGLSYDISEKLSLETSINILSFGYNYTVSKDGTVKDKSSNFNLGAGLDNIVSIGTISIGAIYKF
jgi:hypothetical protein